MGHGHSNQLNEEDRLCKSRQSTRSLPDSRSKKRSTKQQQANQQNQRYVGGAEVVNGVYCGANTSATSDLWCRDAGPYYCPAPSKTRAGPRSLDLSLNKPWADSMHDYQYSMLQNQRYQSEKADGWSDVASDMYRTRERNHGRRSKRDRSDARQQSVPPSFEPDSSRCSSRRSRRYSTRTTDAMETQSEVTADVCHSGRSSRRSSIYKSAASSVIGDCSSGPRSSQLRASKSEHDTLVASPRPGTSPSMHQFKRPFPPSQPPKVASFQKPKETEVDIPPRPPKPLSATVSPFYSQARRRSPNTSGPSAVPGECWIDYPHSSDSCDRELKVKFDERFERPSSIDLKKNEPSASVRMEVPLTPPKSPGSAECDKLVINSLRAELIEERTLRLKAEKKHKELARDLMNQSGNVGKIQALEEQLREAQEKLLVFQDENSRVREEQRQQKANYDITLDNIANKVAKALSQQKTLKTECLKLQKRILEVEWENKLLKAQLKLSVAGSSPMTARSAIYSQPNPHEQTVDVVSRVKKPSINHANLQKFRQSMGSDPTMDLSGMGNNEQMAPSDSLISIASQQQFSLMTNGGEGMFSRPTSFAMDTSGRGAKPSNGWPLFPPSAVVPPLGSPFRPVTSTAPTMRKLETDDLYSQDEVCNFAQRLGESNTSNSTQATGSADSGPVKAANGVPRAADFSAISDASSIERMRGGDSGSSLGSVAFIQNLLNGPVLPKQNETQTSTPKASPSKPRSCERTPTPTAFADSQSPHTTAAVCSVSDNAVGALRDALAQRTKRKLLGLQSPTSHDDGYSTLSSVRQLGDTSNTATAVAKVVKSASFDVASGCATRTLPQQLAGVLSTESLEWDELLMQTLLMTASDCSAKNEEKHSSSSGFSSGADHSADIEAVWRVRGGRCLSSEDIRQLPSPTDSVPSLDAAWSSAVPSPSHSLFAGLYPLTCAPYGLRRVRSESALHVRVGRRSRTERLLCLLLSRRAERAWGTPATTTEANKSFSSCDLTKFERDMLHMQKDTAPSDEEIYCEVDVDREGLFDLEGEENAAISDVEKLDEQLLSRNDVASPTKCDFNNSFYAICHVASPNLNLPPVFADVAQTTEEASNHQTDPPDSTSTPKVQRTESFDEHSNVSTSFTSEDSEDDGTATVQEWVKQLKTKKSKKVAGKSVVRYNPPRTSILRRDVFNRFGEKERKAIASFDFLNEHTSDSSMDGSSENKVRTKRRSKPKPQPSESRVQMREKKGSGNAEHRVSRSLSDLTTYFDGVPVGEESESVYENLPYHSRVRRRQSAGDKRGTEDYAKVRSKCSSVSSLHSADSYDSSLLLSDLCGTSANNSLSSSSSLSFQY